MTHGKPFFWGVFSDDGCPDVILLCYVMVGWLVRSVRDLMDGLEKTLSEKQISFIITSTLKGIYLPLSFTTKSNLIHINMYCIICRIGLSPRFEHYAS